MSFIKRGWLVIKNFFIRLKVIFLFYFKLKPHIVKMTGYINKIIATCADSFPNGKSVLVYSGGADTIYFILFKETNQISVVEVYDDILNHLPENYSLFPRIDFLLILDALRSMGVVTGK